MCEPTFQITQESKRERRYVAPATDQCPVGIAGIGSDGGGKSAGLAGGVMASVAITDCP